MLNFWGETCLWEIPQAKKESLVIVVVVFFNEFISYVKAKSQSLSTTERLGSGNGIHSSQFQELLIEVKIKKQRAFQGLWSQLSYLLERN